MFTGIIEAKAKVLNKTKNQLVLSRPKKFTQIKIGDSIAVSGACLTVISFSSLQFTCDVMPETWKKTKLGGLSKKDEVNLERSLKASERLDGHIVQGHVEGVGKVVSLASEAPTPYPSPVTGEGCPGLPGRGGGFKVKRGVDKLKYPAKAVVSHAREMRKKPTKAESVLWIELKQNKLDRKYFRRQRPVANYVIDFYCEEARLGIEIDGESHLSRKQKEYDRERTNELSARGIRIIRFDNNQVLHELDFVLDEIKNRLKDPILSEEGPGERENNIQLTIKLPSHLAHLVVPKGSIALDGVSLTVVDSKKGAASAALIPHTLKETTLGNLKKGDSINIETDIVGRYVLAFTSNKK